MNANNATRPERRQWIPESVSVRKSGEGIRGLVYRDCLATHFARWVDLTNSKRDIHHPNNLHPLTVSASGGRVTSQLIWTRFVAFAIISSRSATPCQNGTQFFR